MSASSRVVACEMLCQSNEAHLQQIYTGFQMLARQGRIRLTQRLERRPLLQTSAPPHLSEAAASHLIVVADGIRMGYDVHDAGEVDAELLDNVDFYFKRSWESSHVEQCVSPGRVHPLGANLWIYGSAPSWLALQRSALLKGPSRVTSSIRALGLDRLLGDRLFTPRLADLEAPPPVDQLPRVLFLAEAWNPDEAPSQATAEDRAQLNAFRSECMRALRDEFGGKVTCGFRRTPFSSRVYPELVISDTTLTKKRNYLAMVRQHPICVATSGLHHSMGWKFAEYLCMARGIVAETLRMRLPGGFHSNRNYLEFSSAQECAASVRRLFDDVEFRDGMMRNNLDYYRTNVRPDALVAASLNVAVGLGNP